MMKEKIQDLRRFLNEQTGERNRLIKQKREEESVFSESLRNLNRYKAAREIIKKVQMDTQKELEYHLEDMVSSSLEAVFPSRWPYSLKVQFVERRNKTECDLLFEQNGNFSKPLEDNGGGVLDVASFALRTACWIMKIPHYSPIMILDEPFKHLKGTEANLRVLEMVKKISEKLGIQIIMVSDERIPREDTLWISDRTFLVTMNRKISKVEQL